MAAESRPQRDAHLLEIAVESRHLSVSNLSSLLRVFQAALREVARSGEDTRQLFSQQPQPVLHLSIDTAEAELALGFTFTDPLDSTPLPQLSSLAFNSFVDQFAQLLKGLPQRGLWGESVAGAQRGRYDSEIARRLDQLRLEMRRFPRARLSFNRHTISFEGDRMEID